MSDIKVTVILICHNQRKWIKEAVDSVLNQSHKNIELILVDVGSNDGSQLYLKSLSDRLGVRFIGFSENVGNCKAFNVAFEHSNGDFIIDLAADDVLYPHRVSSGLQKFGEMGLDYGFHYSNAEYIDSESNLIGLHHDSLKHLDPTVFSSPFPEGEVFDLILRSYFICPPTMMVRRDIVEAVGGYDENLSFEDFDFWLRASKVTRFCASPKVLVKKRTIIGSQSNNPKFHRDHARSMVKICQKVKDNLIDDSNDPEAFNSRLEYEMRICYRRLLKTELKKLAEIYKRFNEDRKKSWKYYLHILMSRF
ncbi:glycosyltransferase [Marinigracilibium pacificum]|uniref:Glycosyltransferase n=1 Tax=Marinigracilibium pacificum TaxID=2729599 RepID=A0A848J2C5_9BACT|nr:glycosyltransferase [Marinigracilibium pacificum]NMM48634.1 glycosyltransferase [Marinigracilibium pacificum]